MANQTAAGLVSAAKQRIQSLTVIEVETEIAAGDVLLVDIREPEERTVSGIIPGSVHAVRGMLEFYADPTSPYHRAEFETDRRIVLVCASGGRSALATDTLQQLGYTRVAHLDGGLKGWVASGRAIDIA